MQSEAMLVQLGYSPNEALMSHIKKIEQNTQGYEKIQKHIMDLHDSLKVDGAYVALSNSNDFFKIKIDSMSDELAKEAHEKVERFSQRYKVDVEKLVGKETYYIKGFKG